MCDFKDVLPPTCDIKGRTVFKHTKDLGREILVEILTSPPQLAVY